MDTEHPHIIEGRRNIAKFIGVRHDDIPDLVKSGELAAWKRGKLGKWKMFPEDGLDFLRRERDKAKNAV